MLVQLYRDNFVGTPKEELDYEVYTGYFADNLNSTVFSGANLLESGVTIDFTSLATAVGGTISGTDIKSAIIYGFFRAKQTGTYTFFTRSRDASYLRINNVSVVSNNGIHAPRTSYGVYDCVAGQYYPFAIYYGNSGAGQAELSAGFFEPNYNVYPPVALTGVLNPNTGVIESNPSSVSGQPYGNGDYVTSYSGDNGAQSAPFRAFNKETVDLNNIWRGADKYNGGTGAYIGSEVTQVDLNNIVGEWLQIQLPLAISLDYFTLTSRNRPTDFIGLPKEIYVVGSNTGTGNWTQVFYSANVGAWTQNQTKTFITTNKTAFSYFRYIVRTTLNENFTALAEWVLFSPNSTPAITNATGLTTFYDINPETQPTLITADFPLVIEDDSLQGLFRVSPLAVYINRTNFSGTKHDIFYIASDDLFNNFNGTYKNYIQLHEKPVANDVERKRFTQFSSDMSFECDLNGRIEVRFKRGTNDNVNWRYAMLILDVERIPIKNI